MTVQRIDVFPTRTFEGFALRAGRPYPFGATQVPGGINFSVFSSHATACTLVLFRKGAHQPMVEIPFVDEFRIGNVYAMTVFDLDYEDLEYGFRMDGPYDPVAGHRFNRDVILLDPYARLVTGRSIWGQAPDWNNLYQHRAAIALEDFDWENDRPLEIPIEDLIIYELHVRGFTRHPSSGVRAGGTFDGLREKIPYLKALGVNCVELLPVCEFDEIDNSRVNPNTGQRLVDYWGYNPIGFFAPKAGYAATGHLGMQVDELKHLIKELHASGIEVVLDVVFNHTAEGNELGRTITLRGLDAKTYYMLGADGRYLNFSGTGNTLNCNHPAVRNMVLDCLRYWAAEFHVDGFRFDLATILGRDQNGAPLSNPPLLESVAGDPVLAKCKLIAEAWDAGGLYQVGSFPDYGRWAEWNGRYRDTVRRFIKGDPGLTGEIAQRRQGSPDLYEDRGAAASINFVTCHDGFTLHDLVSYNQKHNEANGENSADGTNENLSWNCGWEGPTEDESINALRQRQAKNVMAILMVSRGIPMFLMGDEVGRTQGGNNNAYCHDDETTWLDWSLTETNAELLSFVRRCIAMRKAHPALRTPDISWHGTKPWAPDWSASSRVLAFMLRGEPVASDTRGCDCLYVSLNMHWEALWFHLPPPPSPTTWHVAINTAMPGGEDAWDVGFEPRLAGQGNLLVGGRSVVVLVAR